MTAIRTPRQTKRLPKAITIEQIERLLATPSDADILGVRDRAMLETLYSTGIRVSELVGMNVEDVDDAGEALRIRGKGKKERIVPLGKHAMTAGAALHPDAAGGHEVRRGLGLHQRPRWPAVREQARQAALLPLGPAQAGQVPQERGARPRHQPPHPPPQLRDPPARERRRPALRAGAAGAPVAVDHADLHAPDDAASEGCIRPSPPPRPKRVEPTSPTQTSTTPGTPMSRALSFSGASSPTVAGSTTPGPMMARALLAVTLLMAPGS